jgi:hypothetical protein
MKNLRKGLSIFAALLALAFASSAQATSLHVGEIGKAILFFPNPQPPAQPAANPLSLNGLTVVMECQPPGGTLFTRTMTVEGTGTSCPDAQAPANSSGGCATYSLAAGDLPVPGTYVCQWCACSSSPCTCASTNPTLMLKTDQTSIPVGASF